MNIRYIPFRFGDRSLVATLILALNLWQLSFSAERDYKYTGIDGDEHSIKAYLPKDHQSGDRRPCFVYFHGGGWKSGDLKQGKPLCEYLSSRGIVCISANYSMHRRMDANNGGLSDTPKQTTTLELGESRKRICVIDAKRVIRWVKAHAVDLGIDPGRLIVSGASAGAHIGVLQMMNEEFNHPDDPLQISTDVQAFVLLAAAFTVPKEDQTPEVNVFQHVDRPFPPTLFMVGETDRWAAAARLLAEKLCEKNGNEIEFWIAPGMGHMFMRQGDWYDPTKRLIDRFLSDHGFLTGEPTVQISEVQDGFHRVELK